MNSTEKLLVMLMLLISTPISSSPAVGGGIFEDCPTTLGVAGAEGRCLEAIAAAETSLDSERLARLLEGLAVIYERDGRRQDAIAALRRSTAVSGSTRSYDAMSRLAGLLEQAGELEEARDILESLVSNRESSSRGEVIRRGHAELRLAEIYVELERPDLAEKHYKKSIEDLSRGPGGAPTYPAVVRLARFYLQQQRTEDAIEVCRKYKESRGATAGSATRSCEKMREGGVESVLD